MARLPLNANLTAFLDMISISELGIMRDMPETDDGYKVIVGSTPKHLILMKDYLDHPRQLEHITPTLASTAAGRYQILARIYDAYKRTLNLPDFSPESQDAIAVQLIRERSALPDIAAGRLNSALEKVKGAWASLPASPYAQHTNRYQDLADAYTAAGGIIA